jgi:general stress protein 26
MVTTHPTTELDGRYSSPGATAVSWDAATDILETAEIFWLTTVRPDGRPHVTPLIAVWIHDALYFGTGADERKARNLAVNPQVAVATGCNALNEEGLDIVIEGAASRVIDRGRLEAVADRYLAKYGEAWRFTVGDDALVHASAASETSEPGKALIFRVAPATVFGFGKGTTFSQTRWRF